MATVRIGGASVPLPTFPGLAPQFTGSNAGTIAGLSNAITLGPGLVWNIPPGTFWIKAGYYTFLQFLDPVSNTWKIRPTAKDDVVFIDSDGTNYRLANTTGCVVGAVITTGGTTTTYTNGIGSTATGVTVTASSGASTWQPIVGGAISATTVTGTAGSGYLYPPLIIIDAPPQGGLQATAYVTGLSTGTVPVANIVVTNQGAGYTTAPNITFVNDPRDTAGTGAACTVPLTATGALTGLYPSNHGTALTGAPALSMSAGNAAATALMNFTVTGYAVATTGTGVAAFYVTTTSNKLAAQTLPVVNPMHAENVTFPRPCRIYSTLSGGSIQTTGVVVEDGGLGIQQVPAALPVYAITSTTAAVPIIGAPTVGGAVDTSYVQPV